MKNINLLDFNNDILDIIGGYVVEDNIKKHSLNKWMEVYTKKKIIKDLDKEIDILKPTDITGEEIGNLIVSKLFHTIFSHDDIYDFLSDRQLELETIEKGKRRRCIFKTVEPDEDIEPDFEEPDEAAARYYGDY